jgi:uncharacterized OB-fold protein
MTAHTPLAGLTAYQCQLCQALSLRAPVVCAACLGRQFAAVSVAATGSLASWTTIRKPPLRFKSEGVYHVGVFDLDNGMRVSGRLLHQATDQAGDRVHAVRSADPASDVPVFKVSTHG